VVTIPSLRETSGGSRSGGADPIIVRNEWWLQTRCANVWWVKIFGTGGGCRSTHCSERVEVVGTDPPCCAKREVMVMAVGEDSPHCSKRVAEVVMGADPRCAEQVVSGDGYEMSGGVVASWISRDMRGCGSLGAIRVHSEWFPRCPCWIVRVLWKGY
jgi:hypothetical protein